MGTPTPSTASSVAAPSSAQHLMLSPAEQTLKHNAPGSPKGFRLRWIERLKKRLRRPPAIKENRRWVAALLTVLAGPFGMHRLYLGTEVRVPIFYVVTLGGCFGLIPLIDLVVILASKDLSKYYQNPSFLMWGRSAPQ